MKHDKCWGIWERGKQIADPKERNWWRESRLQGISPEGWKVQERKKKLFCWLFVWPGMASNVYRCRCCSVNKVQASPSSDLARRREVQLQLLQGMEGEKGEGGGHLRIKWGGHGKERTLIMMWITRMVKVSSLNLESLCEIPSFYSQMELKYSNIGISPEVRARIYWLSASPGLVKMVED